MVSHKFIGIYMESNISFSYELFCFYIYKMQLLMVDEQYSMVLHTDPCAYKQLYGLSQHSNHSINPHSQVHYHNEIR